MRGQARHLLGDDRLAGVADEPAGDAPHERGGSDEHLGRSALRDALPQGGVDACDHVVGGGAGPVERVVIGWSVMLMLLRNAVTAMLCAVTVVSGGGGGGR